MSLSQIYSMFASPAAQLDDQIASSIMTSYLADVLARTLLQLNPYQHSQYAWFADLVGQWQQACNQAGSTHHLSALWVPAYANLDKKLESQQAINNNDLIQVALAMHDVFTPRSWQAQADMPQRYRFKQGYLPEARTFEWRNDGTEPYLLCDDVHVSNNVPALESVQLQHRVLFDTQATLSQEKLPYPVSSTGWNAQLWRDACALLQESTSGHADWAQRLLTSVVPLDAPQHYQISASHQYRRGEVLMSWRVRPEQMAEMMVHEASHQHFFMAGMLSQYDDGSDKAHYYSPVVKTQRSLSKILLAYHAFANVILFFRRSRELLEQKERHWIDTESVKVLDELEQLEKPLRETTALTELGQQLWRPLAYQLKETAL